MNMKNMGDDSIWALSRVVWWLRVKKSTFTLGSLVWDGTRVPAVGPGLLWAQEMQCGRVIAAAVPRVGQHTDPGSEADMRYSPGIDVPPSPE